MIVYREAAFVVRVKENKPLLVKQRVP
jgi:hypothetical protein